MYSVYKHTNKINNKSYIGITSRQPKQRWSNGKDYRGNKIFTNDINKYGWDNFTHEILNEVDNKEEAEELERYYIDQYNTLDPKYGYNNESGGLSGFYMSDISKTRFSERAQKDRNSHFGKPTTDEVKKIIGETNKNRMAGSNNIMFGKTHSKESREKLRINNTGRNKIVGRSVKCITNNLIFDSLKEAAEYCGSTIPSIIKSCKYGYFTGKDPITNQKLQWQYNGELNAKGIPILQLDLDKNIIKEWSGAKEISEKLNISAAYIRKCCRETYRTANGYYWRYKEGEYNE